MVCCKHSFMYKKQYNSLIRGKYTFSVLQERLDNILNEPRPLELQMITR